MWYGRLRGPEIDIGGHGRAGQVRLLLPLLHQRRSLNDA
jgi:hypothetical protein